MNYQDKLRDPRWQRKRLQIFERDHWRCDNCSEERTELHVHHKYYQSNLDPWDYPNDSLITLCKSCHEIQTATSQKRRSADLFKPDNAYSAERELVQLMLRHERFIKIGERLLPAQDFQDVGLREIASLLYETAREGREGASQRVIEALSGEEQKALASQLMMERKEYEESELDKLIQDCLGVIESRKRRKPQISELTSGYQRAIAKGQYDNFTHLQKRFLEMIHVE